LDAACENIKGASSWANLRSVFSSRSGVTSWGVAGGHEISIPLKFLSITKAWKQGPMMMSPSEDLIIKNSK